MKHQHSHAATSFGSNRLPPPPSAIHVRYLSQFINAYARNRRVSHDRPAGESTTMRRRRHVAPERSWARRNNAPKAAESRRPKYIVKSFACSFVARLVARYAFWQRCHVSRRFGVLAASCPATRALTSGVDRSLGQALPSAWRSRVSGRVSSRCSRLMISLPHDGAARAAGGRSILGFVIEGYRHHHDVPRASEREYRADAGLTRPDRAFLPKPSTLSFIVNTGMLAGSRSPRVAVRRSFADADDIAWGQPQCSHWEDDAYRTRSCRQSGICRWLPSARPTEGDLQRRASSWFRCLSVVRVAYQAAAIAGYPHFGAQLVRVAAVVNGRAATKLVRTSGPGSVVRAEIFSNSSPRLSRRRRTHYQLVARSQPRPGWATARR